MNYTTIPSTVAIAEAIAASGKIVEINTGAIARDWMDDVIHTEDHLLQNYPYPVLATIPDLTVKSAKKYGYGYYGSAAKKGGVS